jgi:hypothetical protein
MNTILKKYFSFESNILFEPKDLMDNLNEEFVLEGEAYLSKEGIDTSNIYFKLLAQLYYLKSKNDVNDSLLAYVNYIIAYYVGLFLHPINGEFLALKYLNEAIELENDNTQVIKYKELIAMIREEL